MLSANLQLTITFIWILGCVATTLYLLRQNNNLILLGFPYILVVAFIVRLIPAIVLHRGAAYEMHVFQEAAKVFRSGESIYLVRLAHPYLPLQIYWFAIADWLAENIGGFFIFWLKLINILADTFIAGLVYLSVKRSHENMSARIAGWIYVFNPVTILVVAYQGQFDAMPMLFLLLSWYFFVSSKEKPESMWLSAIFLGFAILSKTWPFIFLPIVLLRLPNWKQGVKYTMLSALVPLAGILFFNLFFPGSIFSMLRRVMHAGAISGWWGYSSIVNVWVELTGDSENIFIWISRNGKWLGYLSGLVVIILTRKQALLYSLLLTILAMFAFVPNLGLQGLSWIIPMAVILGLYNSLGWYIIGTTTHMLTSYWGIHLSQNIYQFMPVKWANIVVQLSSLTAWFTVVVWLVQEILHKRLFPLIFSEDREAEYFP